MRFLRPEVIDHGNALCHEPQACDSPSVSILPAQSQISGLRGIALSPFQRVTRHQRQVLALQQRRTQLQCRRVAQCRSALRGEGSAAAGIGGEA